MAEPSTEFRILSLAGGGYLGLYTACVLAHLEERAGEPLGMAARLEAVDQPPVDQGRNHGAQEGSGGRNVENAHKQPIQIIGGIMRPAAFRSL